MLFHVTVILLRKVADDSRNMLQFPHNFKKIRGVTDFLLMHFIIFYNFVQHIFQFWPYIIFPSTSRWREQAIEIMSLLALFVSDRSH